MRRVSVFQGYGVLVVIFAAAPAFAQGSFSNRSQDQRCFQEREVWAFEVTKKASFKTGGEVWSSPAIMSDGTVVVGSFDGHVYFLNPDGTKKASFKTGGGVWSSPAIMSDGTVVVGSDDGHVYFLNSPKQTGKKETVLVQVPRLPNGECPPKVSRLVGPESNPASMSPKMFHSPDAKRGD